MEKESVMSERVGENLEKDVKNVEDMEAITCKENKMRDIICSGLQEQMAEIRQDVLELVNNRMNVMVSEILQIVNKMALTESRDLVDSETYNNRTKSTRQDTLPTKQFLQRNSLLTDLYEIKHIRTIYNVILSTLIVLLIHTAVYDIRNTGSPNFAINTVKAGFAKISVVLCVWLLMKSAALANYVAFCYWATNRLELLPKSFARKVWDYSWLVVLILYQLLYIVLPAKAVVDHDLPIASSMIVLMEQLRLIMKTHAFIRSVAPRFLSYKPHSEAPVPKPPDFSKYLYFMFAPTLIYQDSYPRSKRIRWNVVLANFAEVVTIVFFVGFIYERLLYPIYRDFGKEPIELGMLILNILSSMLPGILMFVCGFYCLLHCWMNAFAELLRFADKMFYKDWWTSISYSTYYRTWNIVVHDWLYTYIYKDMYEIITPGNRKLAVCTVFAISAIFHEYILCLSVRFFYPIMLVLFGVVGFTVVFVLKRAGNVFLWFSLSCGSGTLVSLYCIEYFARINCPPYREDFMDYVIPRTLTCIFHREVV
ncbi:sterol O-acyltransferase 1 isoform X1 [Megachile rotundata]|uniref:sterol O-acyltransferase 1 isoform X1 n=1 Tax=Megachile rotundata TaxID=143995 RepID=UPI000258E03E|nr:PREDICTED: sterol O-acyltransferase 1 [Megachile rotundata]XP_012138666.1 PREDICTED: sterol O-acyltransferase 1 [Megachile rotundata]